jgi:FAD/FMN-containing dehydrogenase
VALALKIVTFVRSKFAVCSCGHSANPGFASIGESGVLLDLGALNEISLSKEKNIVSLGPGAKWDEVYEELEKEGLTVVGGRVAGVGVGGLITGGSSLLLCPHHRAETR